MVAVSVIGVCVCSSVWGAMVGELSVIVPVFSLVDTLIEPDWW